MRVEISKVEHGWNVDFYCDKGHRCRSNYIPNTSANIIEGIDSEEEAKKEAENMYHGTLICCYCINANR